MGRPPLNRWVGQAAIGGAQVLYQLETGDIMHLPINSPKRLIGAAAIACTMALIPWPRWPPQPPRRCPRQARRYATSGLLIWFSPQLGGGYAGGYYYNLNFTNLSGYACTLQGYPGVSAVNPERPAARQPGGLG
jgi:Domain of unknown function (DUF4232)